MQRGPVFNPPASPKRASSEGRGLVRIVDPVGLAIAWFDPGSACCVGFMVQSPDQGRAVWRPVLAALDEQATEARPGGCAVLAALGDDRSRTMDAEPANDWSRAGWSLLERDPTSIVLETALRANGHDLGPGVGDVSGRLTARLEDATLSLALSVWNDRNVACSVAFGFRLVLAPEMVNETFQVLIHQGGEWTPLPRPAGSGVGWLTGAPDGSLADMGGGDHLVKPGGAPPMVVRNNEGVQYVELQEIGIARSMALAVLGAPPGQPVLLVPGARAQLEIAIAVRHVGDDRAP